MVKSESALDIFCNFFDDEPSLAESAGRLRADNGLSDKFCVDDSIDSMLQRKGIVIIVLSFTTFIINPKSWY
jgi:hypothetical protein